MPPRAAPRCWDSVGDASLPFGRESSFCASWPSYNANPTTAPQRAELTSVVDRLIAAHEKSGVQEGRLESLLRPPCAQRLCLRVQIMAGSLYVVAPESRACRNTGPVGNCSRAHRTRLEGLAMTGAGRVGKWSVDWSPTPLEWNFVAGLNVSDCSAATRPGDVNGPFTRLRLLTQLRLLDEAAREGAEDTELVLCAGETPLNAGDWCLPSTAQPLFAATGNEAAPVLPLPHWLPGLRDVDFSVWDEARRAMRAASAGARFRGSPAAPAPVAVFRGGLYRLTAYSNEWRKTGLRRTRLSRHNWRHVGRLALLHAKADPAVASLIDVNIALPEGYAGALGIENATLALMDQPASVSLADQAKRFQFVINAEGHGGWADRLGRLLLSPQLVLTQDLAATLWFEGLLTPNVTHLVVDSNFRNLSRVVEWARKHPSEARAMVARANEVMETATSVGGIRFFVAEMLRQYTRRLLRYKPRRDERAVRFSCLPSGKPARCRPPGERSIRHIPGTGCAFEAADGSDRRLSTLHAASKTIRRASSAATAPPDREALDQARAMLCDRAAGPAPEARGAAKQRWCFEISDPVECRRHSVRKRGRRWGGRRCACAWHEDLQAIAPQVEAVCAGAGLSLAAGTAPPPGCVSACCPALCDGAGPPQPPRPVQVSTDCKVVVNSGGAQYAKARAHLFASLYSAAFRNWADVIVVMGDTRAATGPQMVPISRVVPQSQGLRLPTIEHEVVLVTLTWHNFDYHAFDVLYTFRDDPLIAASGYLCIHDTVIVSPRFPAAFRQLTDVFTGFGKRARSEAVIFSTPPPNANVVAISAAVPLAYGHNFANVVSKEHAIQMEFGGHACHGKDTTGCVWPITHFGRTVIVGMRSPSDSIDLYGTGHARVPFYYPAFGLTKLVMWGGTGDMHGKLVKTRAINPDSEFCRHTNCKVGMLMHKQWLDITSSPFVNKSAPFAVGRYGCVLNVRITGPSACGNASTSGTCFEDTSQQACLQECERLGSCRGFVSNKYGSCSLLSSIVRSRVDDSRHDTLSCKRLSLSQRSKPASELGTWF